MKPYSIIQKNPPLYQQLLSLLRTELLPGLPQGSRLPPDRELIRRYGVSARTVREALLILEAEGTVQRQQGLGSVVCRPNRPVALFSEMNILDPQTPRYFALLLNVVRERLEAAGYSTRLYTGRDRTSSKPSGQDCCELFEDAEAGHLGGIIALTTTLDSPRAHRLRKAGLPMVHAAGDSALTHAFNVRHALPEVANYLSATGCRRVGLIGWNVPHADGRCELTECFAEALHQAGLPFSAARCRVEMSHAVPGAGWEAFREIWSASREKPDALIVSDENYLPEVVMALQEMRLRVPVDLLLVSHQTQHVEIPLPVPVARIELNVDALGNLLADQALAALAGNPMPPIPTELKALKFIPLNGSQAQPELIPFSESIDTSGQNH